MLLSVQSKSLISGFQNCSVNFACLLTYAYAIIIKSSVFETLKLIYNIQLFVQKIQMY